MRLITEQTPSLGRDYQKILQYQGYFYLDAIFLVPANHIGLGGTNQSEAELKASVRNHFEQCVKLV